MASRVTKEDVKRIALLCRLKVTEEEISLFSKLFTETLKYMDMLNELDTTGVAETYQVTGLTNVFQKVTEARSALMSAKTPDQAGQANNMLTGALKSLFAVAEAYPELKAQTNFSQLQTELADTEDKIAYSRQFYNATVRDFNTKVVTFPNSLVAKLLGFKEEAFFEVAEAERAVPKVSF